MHAEATVVNAKATADDGVTVKVDVFDAQEKLVAQVVSSPMSVGPGAEVTVALRTFLASVELWSVPRPYLYIMAVSVLDASGRVVDSQNITTGIKTVEFDANKGLILNEENVKVRGMCDHRCGNYLTYA